MQESLVSNKIWDVCLHFEHKPLHTRDDILMQATVKIPARERHLFIYYSIVPLSASLHFKLNALLFRRMRVASRSAADSRCGSYLATRFVEMHCAFLSFLLRGSTRTLHQVSRKARMLACLTFFLPLGVPPSRFFFLFCLFLPLTPVLPFRAVIFALKHSYVTRYRVIRRVIRTAGSFFILRTHEPLLALYRVAHLHDCQARFVTFENYFELTRLTHC